MWRRSASHRWAVLLSVFLIAAGGIQVWAAPADKRLAEAEGLLAGRQYAAAVRAYEALLSADPTGVAAYRGLVKAYGGLGDPNGAVVFLEGLFLDAGESAAIAYGLGYALYAAGKNTEAARWFERAVALDPELAEAWNNRAAIYHFVERDFEQARAHYEKALAAAARSGDQRTADIARQNLANLPAREITTPITEALELEAFVARFVGAAENGDRNLLQRLVSGQRSNSAEAVVWLLEEAMGAAAEGRTVAERTAVDLAVLIADLYWQAFSDNGPQERVAAYRQLGLEDKKRLPKGEAALARGLAAEKETRFAEAAAHYREALACFTAIGLQERIGLVQAYLGDALSRLEDYPGARAAYESALKSFRRQGAADSEGAVLTALGRNAALTGAKMEALQYLEAALAAFRRGGDTAAATQVAADIERLRSHLQP